MKALTQFFDTIGSIITSLAAVIFVMLMTITGMIFFSHTLFSEIFPATMRGWEKAGATWVLALGWEFTVVITTCNSRHINRHIPLVMAVASGIVVLFFIQAFDGTQGALIIAQRWFVGLLAATINYIYAELFYAKWTERNQQQLLPRQLDETRTTLVQLRSELDEARSALVQAQRDLDERGRKVVELERFRKEVQSELTCEHCHTVQKTYGALRAHKGHCKANPINKPGQLNGASV